MSAVRRKLTHLLAWRAFEVVARTGTFVAAAEELGVTAAAVSQHVRTLEDYLGVKLLQRTSQGAALTTEGMLVHPGVRDGFRKIADAVQRLQHRNLERIVRVTAPPSFASRWLLCRLHRFIRCHPDLDVNLDATERLVDFHSENYDIGVRYGKGNYLGLQSELLFDEFVFPVCSPSLLPCREGSPHPLTVLKAVPLIHDTTQIEFDHPTWRTWLAERGCLDIDADKGLYLNSMLAVQAAVDGRGILLGRSVIVADDLASDRLVRPFSSSHKLDRGYYLVYKAEQRDVRKVKAFRDWVRHEAALTREADSATSD